LVDNVDSEKPSTPLMPAIPAYQRSLGLSRPKSRQKQLPLDRFYRSCANQAPVVKGLIITVVTGLPFLIFLLVTLYVLPPKISIGPKELGATVFELSKWLFVCWASFMVLLWCGRVLAAFSAWVCSMARKLAGYERLAETLSLRMVLLLWAAVCYAMVSHVFHHSLGTNIEKDQRTVYNWVHELQKTFMFLMIAFAIVFFQGIILELASVTYIQGWMGPRSQRASDELATVKELQHLVNPHVSVDDIGFVGKICKKLFLPIDSNDLYYQISHGEGDEEMWTQYATKIWNSISQGKQALTRFDVDQQLRDMNRDPSRGHDLFTQIDESCDGNVTQEELEKLVQRIGLQLNVRAQAQRGIQSLLRKLEAILSIVMLGIILFLYSMFTRTSRRFERVANFRSSSILCQKCRKRPRYLLDGVDRLVVRLRWCASRIYQLLCLRVRQAPLRCWRLHRGKGQEAHRQQDLLDTYELRGGRTS